MPEEINERENEPDVLEEYLYDTCHEYHPKEFPCKEHDGTWFGCAYCRTTQVLQVLCEESEEEYNKKEELYKKFILDKIKGKIQSEHYYLVYVHKGTEKTERKMEGSTSEDVEILIDFIKEKNFCNEYILFKGEDIMFTPKV